MGIVRKPSWRGPGLRGGLGDANPVPPNFCNNRFAWAIPACWNFTRGAIYGDKYPAPPMPPPVGSTLPDGSPIPAVPPDAESPQLVGVGAGQIAQSVSDQQIADWQAQTQQFFEDLNPSVNPPDDTGKIPSWVWWAALGVGAFVVLGARR